MIKKSDDFLGDRRKALEDSFFEKHNRELLEKLRHDAEQDMRKAVLKAASGIDDCNLIERFVELELCGETILALSLVPLVEVAWADGKMQSAEKEAILRAARDRGIKRETPAFEMLECWLSHPLPPEMLTAWKDYVGALSERLTAEELDELKTSLLGRAREVAESAGGFLGLGGVSGVEKEMLEDLEKAFG